MPRSLLLLVAVPLLLTLPAQAARDGFVSERKARSRALRYLRFATSEVATGSILNAIAHMERDAVDSRYTAPAGAVDVNDWARTWEKLDTLLDTRDFDGLYILMALLGYEGHPYLSDALWERIRTSLLSFKMWWTDPTPPQPDPDDPARTWDDSYYWTENHQILYHAIEYLAGQRFPDACFWIVGFTPSDDCTGPGEMTGAQHRDRARGYIDRWMEERWLAGFSEWFSNVYYQKDATPLLALAEFAEDPEVATRAAILLDVLLLDMATHQHRNVLGTTHGRSSMKDKYRGPTEDTWGLSLLLFGRLGKADYVSKGDPGATLFARAKRYRLPRVIQKAAKRRKPYVARTRQSYPLDEDGPVVPDPEHPEGHDFSVNEPNFTFWWGLGAQTAWQVVPLTVVVGDAYGLWDTSNIRPFRALRDLLGDPPDLDFGQQLAVELAPAAAVGLLREANTYTYRTRDYMLSSVQDFRKGKSAAQVHSGQATLDAEALVFTQHPMNPVQPPSEWVGRDEGQPGYWSGEATMPRSGQYENVAIHLYSPGYAPEGLLSLFAYQPVTHAYFPQDQFDKVVRRGNWTFGKKGKAYVALYSWRPTEWQACPPEELALLGNAPKRSFDLVAPGGPSNVWILEMGSERESGGFGRFRRAVRAARVEVTPSPGPFGHEVFDVFYRSPSVGPVEFGWDAPLRVRGQEVPLADYPRADNPWVRAERGDPTWVIEGSGGRVVLGWAAGTRAVSRR